MTRTAWFRPPTFDRRLLVLIAVAALIIAGELAARGWDAHQRLDAEVAQVRARAALLAASSDHDNWAARTHQAAAQRDALRARLWQSPTEAQAQARLRDWLTNAIRSAGAAHATVTLLPLQSEPAASGVDALPALRARATVNFDLAPNALENALVQIEGGGQLARVDNIDVQGRSRRVEMVVSVPVLLRTGAAR
ncbi:MAG: hypothetical protein KGN16_03220 [Burkholderiales bacterium]|nr:hypothetical protein [Burkholderiales bacterium]